ncbi:putative DNA binding domain-containing protein [Candidatus Woesearchaeota archaeon]|nr:putative DNA binding domain-containing protein [Candidatus Woesearchaeota archaeon]
MEQSLFKELAALDEGASLEFKRSLSDSDKICQTICAFANTTGGLVVFGIQKQGRKPIFAGIGDTDAAQRELQNWIHNNLRPQLRYSLDTARLEGRQFVLLTIEPLPLSEICSFKHGVWRRSGSANIELSGEHLVTFLRERGMLSFEELHSPARLGDMDTGKIRNLLRARRVVPEEHEPINYRTVLESMGVAVTLDRFILKKSAPLFFAKDVSKFQPNCEVRIVRFRGGEHTLEAKDEDKRHVDTIPELLRTAFDAIIRMVGAVSAIKHGQRADIPALPAEVVREALTNAVGHRDYIDPNGILVEVYDDRLQITNPGSLLSGQTIKNFADTRRHRNPTVHRLLNDAGWGEGLYFGIKLMYRKMREGGFPDPEFQDLGGYFRVVLHTARSHRKRKPMDVVNERQAKAIAYLERHKSIRTSEYARIVEVSTVTAVKDLNELVRQGRLKKVGTYRGAHYTKS